MDDDSSQHDENSNDMSATQSDSEDGDSKDNVIKHQNDSSPRTDGFSKKNNGDALPEDEISMKEENDEDNHHSDSQSENIKNESDKNLSDHEDESDEFRQSQCHTPNEEVAKMTDNDQLEEPQSDDSDVSSRKRRKRKCGRRRLRTEDTSTNKESNKDSEDAVDDINKDQTNSRLTDQEEFQDSDKTCQGFTENDTPKTKRALRKTTTNLRDSLTNREIDGILNEGGMDDEPELPPKRRRKRARPRSASYETETANSQLSDLELGYKILEQIMVFPSATPFLDQPDEKSYKMENYYEYIKSPIWLKEIERKYHDKEYSIVSELIRDIRRVFENCYDYWGAFDPLSKKALRVEEFLEKKISLLQPSFKQQCSLDVTHGEQPGEDEEEDETNKEEQPTSENKRYCQMIKKCNFVSKLLRRVISRKSDSEMPSRRIEEVEEISKEVENWENSILLVDDVVNQISAMWELPVIGHFFYLTFNVLNIKPISQFELERMLLMPQASIMLAKVMTTMLIPPLSRAKLEVGPPMPYCVWTAKLKTKVSSWYRIYRQARGQTLKVFEQIGIEPDFWSVLDKKKNPLETSEFHELSFFQKVWLLKSLCDFLLHNHKTIQDVINNIEPEELREKCLGKDRLGYTYHYFPEFSEVRIYKQAKVPESKWHGFEAGVEEVISGAAEEAKNKSETKENKLHTQAAGIKKFLHKLPRSVVPSAENFKLVASSVEDIRCLIDELCSADSQVVQGRGPQAPLVMGLNAIVSELEPIESTLINSVIYIRKKMYQEWTDYKNRDPDYIDPGFSYWERREKDHPEKEEKQPAPTEEAAGENSIADQPEQSERRERRSKRESQIRYMNMDFDGLPEDADEDEEYFEEDEDSEDEWTASPSKKKKKAANNKRMKKFSEQMKLQPDGISNRRNSNSSFFPFGEVRIKQENIKKEKIETESDFNYLQPNTLGLDLGFRIKQEPETFYPQPKQEAVKQELHVPSQTVVRTLVKFSTPVQQQCSKVPIKRSNSPESEIVEISDEDPDSPPDVKPVLDDLRSIKTVDCVVPLVDQRVGSRPPYNQNQFLGQYPNSSSNNNNANVPFTPSRDNPVYLNNISNVTPFASPVRGSSQQAVPAVRSPHNPNIIYSQSNMGSPSLKQSPQPSPLNQNIAYSPSNMTPPLLKQSPQSFMNNSKNILQTNSSPQARNSQNYFANTLNNKNASPVNRPFVNSSSPQLVNKSPVPRQNFIRSPTIQRSPRGSTPMQNMPSPRGALIPSPGRGRPRTLPNIRMPSPSQRGGPVRQVSPQQINNKVLGNSPQLRQRSPSLISQRNVTPPQQRMPGTSFTSPANRFQNSRTVNQPLTPQARRNLNFSSPTRPASQDPPLQIVNTGNVTGKNVKTVEGKLTVALTDDGSYGYHVILSDGGRVTLTNSQLSELRAKNGGSLPQKVGVPMVQSSD